MDLLEFVEKIAEQFESGQFQSDTKFKALDDWSSLLALSVIAMIDEEYNVTIKGKDLLSAETIEDLFNIIKRYKT